jgi:hypothetical protein
LGLRGGLEALAAAKLVESQDPHSKHVVSDHCFRELCRQCLDTQDQEKLCSLPNDGMALLAYAIASSKALQGHDASPGVLDTGSEEINNTLAPFACLTEGEVEKLMLYYKRANISPEKMVEFCKNSIFFTAISQCEELRRITITVYGSNDEANLMLMMQDEKLNGLSWEIRRIRREGVQSSENVEHRPAISPEKCFH